MPEHLSNLSEGQRDDGPGALPESPQHGFRGGRLPAGPAPSVPASLTVALSRESGSRGGSIARRAGAKLGWQVYSQELLEFVAQEGAHRQEILDNLSPAAAAWVDAELDRLLRAEELSRHPSLLAMARMVLALGATGEVVLVGRGAGYLLPRASTLHVRIVAPREERIAYMSQWLRLTRDEAAEQVQIRDDRRAAFLSMHFHRQAADFYQYDLLLNSSLLGEDLCAELIAQAARAKFAAWAGSRTP
jgi:cytidylate kinase